MPRNISVEEGERLSIYISKEVREHLVGIENVSDYIRRLILEATDAGDKVKIAKELVELKERRLKAEGHLMEIDLMISKLEEKMERVTHNEEFYNVKRNGYIGKWRTQAGYHGNFWPNLEWFNGRLDVVQECGFKSPEEALNWFNENRKIHI
jgi:Arc/MetJ-type ribon-helix-helix transcriptional regulator